MNAIRPLRILWLALVLWATGLPGCASEPSGRFDGHGPLAEALTDAARETGVPVSVLAAAVFSETRWRHIDAEPGEAWGRGAFQLDPPTLQRAARAVGVDEETTATDLRVHARAVARLVRSSAGASPPAGFDESAWVEHLAALRGTPEAASLLVEGARGWLHSGFSVERPGERASLEPSLLNVARGAARPDQAGVRWVASPNFSNRSRGRGEVDTIVIHVTQGSYGGAVSWFQNGDSQVSAHYVIRSSDGQVTQMVEEEDVAWHARCWNGRSVGIEHEGWVDEAQWFTDEMYRSSAALVRGIAARWNIPLDRAHIKGHNELVDCNDHSDPGRHWDWDRFMAIVRDGGDPGPAPATGRLLGFVREGDIQDADANIAGARVSVAGGPEVRTAANGLYTFEALPPGVVRVRVEAEGFGPVDLEREVAAGADAWGSVALERAEGPAPPTEPPAPPTTPPPAEEPASTPGSNAPPSAPATEPPAPTTEPAPPNAPTTDAPSAPAKPPMEDEKVPDAAGVLLPPANGANAPGPIGAVPQRHSTRHEGGCSTSPTGSTTSAGAAWALAALLLLRRRRRRT